MSSNLHHKNVDNYFNEGSEEFFKPFMPQIHEMLARSWGPRWDAELGIKKDALPHLHSEQSQYHSPIVNTSFHCSLVLGTVSLLSFNLDNYPACCAMYQMNNFKHYNIGDDVIKAVVDRILRSVQRNYHQGLKRLVLNVVERPRYTPRRADGGRDLIYKFGDIPPLEGTSLESISYKSMYLWAKSHKHQELLTVNHNTDNIIHFMDVMIGSL